MDQVTQKLKEQGYTVRRIEVSHNCYEVKGTDAKDARGDMHVESATAEIVTHGDRG